MRAGAGPPGLTREFGEIVVRESPQGGVVRVKDVARVDSGRRTTRRPTMNGNRVPLLPFTSCLDRTRLTRRRRQKANGGDEKPLSLGSRLHLGARLDSIRRRRHKEIIITLLFDRDWPRDHGGVTCSSRMARDSDSPAGGAVSFGRNVRSSFLCSASPSTPSRYLVWCSRLAWWWTTPLWWWKPWNVTSKTG